MKNTKLNKVAQITLLFWVMKIVATTLGETLGDYVSMTLNLGYSSALLITSVFFLLILFVQLLSKKYIPAIYWLVVISTTTSGTEISDFIDRSLHLGYYWGSLLLLSCLTITLLLWYRKYKSLNVYPITVLGKEIYFWIAVLFSNSLGTAFGDFLGADVGLSYIYGALVTGVIILTVIVVHYFTKANRILLFWVAFIFTRPFGATFGDLLTKPVAKGGLDLGTLNSSIVCVIIIAVLIFISHKTERNNLLPEHHNL